MNSKFIGAVDFLTCSRATGWALYVDNKNIDVLVEAIVNNEVVSTAFANETRDDLFNHAKDGKCGFVLKFNRDINCDDVMSLRFSCAGESFVPSLPKLSEYEGFIDYLDEDSVVGWAWNLDKPEKTVYVEAVENGEVIGGAFADELRPDLIATGRSGRSGFNFRFVRRAVSCSELLIRVGHGETLFILQAPTGVATSSDGLGRDRLLGGHIDTSVIGGQMEGAEIALRSSEVVVATSEAISEAGAAPVETVPAAAAGLKLQIDKIVCFGGELLVSGWIAGENLERIIDPVCISADGADHVVVDRFDYRADLEAAGVADGFAAFNALFARVQADKPLAIHARSGALTGSFVFPDSFETLSSGEFSSFSFDTNGVRGYILTLDDKREDGAELLVEDHPIALALAEPRSTPAFWRADGLAKTEFHVPARDILHGLRARGLDAFNSEKCFTACLRQGGVELARASSRLLEAWRGNFETMLDGAAAGWFVSDPTAPAEIDVRIDGHLYLTSLADRARRDLVAKGIAERGGGFRIRIANPDTNAGEKSVSVHPAFFEKAINGSPKRFASEPARSSLSAIYSCLAAHAQRKVSIVIPVYNAFEDVVRCLDSLRQWTSWPARVIVINDCSTDPRIRPYLDTWAGEDNFEIHHNPANLGFTRTVNKAIALAPDDDVIFLNSDTIVTPFWLQGLRAAAYSGPKIATATPLSNNAGVFSAPEMNCDNPAPPNLQLDDLARLVRQAAIGAYPRVPTGNGFCMYVRRDALDTIGGLDEAAFPVGYGEENDFCMRALRAGYEHVMDDRTYIFHKRSASFGPTKSEHYARGRDTLRARYPEYQKLTAVFSSSTEILGMRWRIRKALAAAKTPRPRVLFVISTETGGTPQTNRDLMAALAGDIEPWLLRCDSNMLHLKKFEAEGDTEHFGHRLREPIDPLLHRSQDYDEQLTILLVRYGFELVHCRHLGWHSLGLQDACASVGVPFVLSLHDFYTVCPSIKLLDENAVHCRGACTDTEGDCAVELWNASQFPALKNTFIHGWRAKFEPVLRKSDALVTTSESARNLVRSVYPSLEASDFRVIPHGRDFDELDLWTRVGRSGRPLRILAPGNLSLAKGAELIRSLIELDRGETFEFHILGDPGRLKAGPGIVIHGRYKRDDFPRLARAICANVGAVFSLWPETYCHTLTEMWAIGMPVIGMDIGAVGERIKAHGGGWLLRPDVSSQDALTFLRGLADDRDAIAGKIAEIDVWQRGYGQNYSTNYMASYYLQLYREVTRGGAVAGLVGNELA